MLHSYRIYGLDLSTELQIPGAYPLRVAEKPDVMVRVGRPAGCAWRDATLVYRSTDRGPNGQEAFTIERSPTADWYRWTWCDGIIFWMDGAGQQVHVQWPPGESSESAAYYFVGPILAFLLRRRRVCLLHGSGVVSGGDAVALLGDSGAGKSTLAAAILRHGYAALTDDLIAITTVRDLHHVSPGYAGLRLWQDSAEAIYGPAAVMPRLVANSDFWPDWDKRFLHLDTEGGRFMTAPSPIRLVYVIAPRTTGPPRIEDLAPTRMVMELDRNVYHRFLRNDNRKREDFAVFTDLARQARVRLLIPGNDIRDIELVARLILSDLSNS